MGQTAKGKASGDSLIAFLNAEPSIQVLSFVGGVKWAKGVQNEPVYPSNPLADCPMLTVRMYQDDVGAGRTAGASKADAVYSLWVKLRQTPGQDHHQILVGVMETIINTLMGNWRPAQLAGTYGAYPASPQTIHEDLRHEFDDPSLRVSVGEIALRIPAKATG